jgi:hypothetical protein
MTQIEALSQNPAVRIKNVPHSAARVSHHYARSVNKLALHGTVQVAAFLSLPLRTACNANANAVPSTEKAALR